MGADGQEKQRLNPFLGRGMLECELEEAIGAGDMVVVCWEAGCTMHRLPHWAEHRWVSREQVPDYKRYSHGICRWHYQAYRDEIERAIAAEMEAGTEKALTAT